MTSTTTAATPWYREALVWLLIIPPAVAVVAGFFTLYLAIVSDDGLVTDDYYQKGKTINRVLQRDHAAAHHGYAAVLSLDMAHNRVAVNLTRKDKGALPQHLTLRLLYATRGNLDQTINLERGTDNTYHATLSDLVAGHWNLQIEADDWRLVGSLWTPAQVKTALQPAV